MSRDNFAALQMAVDISNDNNEALEHKCKDVSETNQHSLAVIILGTTHFI